MKTLNKAKHTLLLVSILLPQLLYAEYFRHIGVTKGLPQFSVMAIHQDELGRMWFGTKEGVCVYDGNTVKTYRAYVHNHRGEDEKVLIGNDVQMIQGNKEGNVFIIADFTLLKYDIRKESFQKIAGNTAHSLASYNGDIWCMLNDSLHIYNEEKDELEFVFKVGIDRSYCLTVTENQYYIGGKDGVYVVNRNNHEITKIIDGVEIYRIFESRQKEIWVGCRMDGLYRIDKDMHVLKVPYSPGSGHGIGSHQIREFIEDEFSNIWFGTFDGLYKYDFKTKKYSSVKLLRKSAGGLQHPSVFSLHKDRQGTIWIGSYYGGVNYFNPESDIFTRYDYEQYADRELYFSFIGGMVEDNDHNIWIGTDGGGLSCMNRSTGVFTNFKATGKNSLPHNNLKSIAYDGKRNHLYIGTYLGGVSRYDITNKRFHNYHSGQAPANGPNNSIFDVLFYRDRLYVTSRNGFFSMNPNTNEFERIHPHLYCRSFDISDDRAWLALGRNLVCMDLKSKQQVENIFLGDYGADFEITKVKTTKSGVYVATLGSGLFYYDKTTQKITRYTEEEGHLLSNYCYNLAETNQGNILITGDKGIVLFSPINQEFRSIGLLSGFPASPIMKGCGVLVASDDEILIGDIEGITSFKETDLKTSDINLYFSKLSVNNQSIYPADNTGILKEALPFSKELKLSHNQNNLIISFAVSNYVNLLQNNWYEYKLDGFDKEWISTQQMELHYTNLNPGKYTLHIRSKGNNPGADSGEITQLIVIRSPWYNTIWAWMIYLSILSLTIFYFLRNKSIKRKLALSLERERFEKQQMEEVNRAKLLFFTNVSHEFRTPLTLIISHIELLLQSTSLSAALYDHVMKINKHALRMRSLVSELLDFRKFDQNHIELKIAEQDLVAFLKEIHLSFSDYARQRNITFLFYTNTPQAMLWFDARQLEKVFFNLISNAFKYTPEGGEIQIKILFQENAVIEITDNGSGIEASKTKYIFERFYQAGNEQEGLDISPGTGIGLALTKSIVEKHHGNISVESLLGKGSTFSIELPKGKEHFRADKNVILADSAEALPLTTDPIPTPMEMEETPLPTMAHYPPEEEAHSLNSAAQHTILVVEDNEDLLRVLQQLFTPFYRVVLARNGKQGLSVMAEEKPDLIISDIMMPEMTGTEMCLQIKSNIDYCHIPIILLTALNTIEHNIEGLNRGADDYITKPFSAKMLLVKCNNLIRNRLLIQQQFTRKPISEIDLTTINPLDKDLLKKTIRIIEENIDDPEFDVPRLGRELGMGRTLLYSKFKALTGMTPNNFILNHKLNKAVTLLQTRPEMQISEIADCLGFGSPIYFSRCFKTRFNASPQSYRKKTD